MRTRTPVLLRSTLIAHNEIARELGALAALGVLSEVAVRLARGEPYRGLPEPGDRREAETRRELAPVVVLWRCLRSRMEDGKAYQVTRRISVLGSLVHLRSIYPSFGDGDFLKIDGGDGSRLTAMFNAEFAFADTRLVRIDHEQCAFDVVACRIAGALEAVGAGCLAPVFCEIDSIYFPIYEPGITLRRTQTIIHGGRVCDFRFTSAASREGGDPSGFDAMG